MKLIKRFFSLLFDIMVSILIIILVFSAIIYFLNKKTIKPLPISSKKEAIGVLNLKGLITSSDEFIKNLKDFIDKKNIKAVIISINSPGGAVVPSQEIYREILKLKKKKPIIAYIKSVGASGAYYIASACSLIFANPGSITGSIGVLAEFTNFKELLEKVGIKSITIKSGKFKDVGNPARDMTDEEKEYLKKLILNIYNQFLYDVAKARGIKVNDLKKIADGRVFTGKEALKLKLIDKLGNFYDVVDYLKKKYKFKEKPEIIYYPERKIIFREIVNKIHELIMLHKSYNFMYLAHFK